ncbi:MAG: phospholipase D family protein [Roseobacter sp.]
MRGFEISLIRLSSLTMLGGALTLTLWVSACAQAALDALKPITYAETAPAQARLVQAAKRLESQQGSAQTHVIPVVGGSEALGVRLRIIERAQHTLDLQYFLMKPDLAGALVTQALLQAADRGVRVRFLVDDIFTPVSDQSMALVAAHPNVAMRIFNPAARPGPKSLGLLTDFSRVNRRMHNKSFTADGAVAVIGGRNIADEYYQIQTTSEFADFDTILIGPAVADIAEAFDLYWNDGWSVPGHRLYDMPSSEELAEARVELDAQLVPARATYEAAVNSPHFAQLTSGKSAIYSGDTTVVVDTPDKVKTPIKGGQRVLAENLLGRIKNARKDVLVVTPYFVPEDYGAELFEALSARGVTVRIVTNSVGSTNHAYVHAGYKRHREALLKAGVQLNEVRPDALQALGKLPADDGTGLVMHTKLFVIDDEDVFVGSLNFDPRSIKLNTEFGVFIKSPAFARSIHTELAKGLVNFTYRLSLDEEGEIHWHYDNPEAPSVTRKEPNATLWKTFVIGVTGLLNVELQL